MFQFKAPCESAGQTGVFSGQVGGRGTELLGIMAFLADRLMDRASTSDYLFPPWPLEPLVAVI